jgi:hypothetical protein
MPAMTNLLVKDDAATPKEWTFQPVSDTPVPYWRTADVTLPLEAQPRFTMSQEKLKDGTWLVKAKLDIPVLETLGASGTALGYVAPPKVAYVSSVNLSFFASARSTIQNRSDALKMFVGLLQGASSTTATGVLNQASAGSAFSASVLPITQAIVQVILPN